MTCEQAKSNTFIDNREAETTFLTGARPFNAEVEVTSFETPSSPTPFHAPVGQLTFSIQDKLGNKLPVKKLFCRVTINDASVYDTKQRKFYPPIPATAPLDDDDETYRLKKIDELEKF